LFIFINIVAFTKSRLLLPFVFYNIVALAFDFNFPFFPRLQAKLRS